MIVMFSHSSCFYVCAFFFQFLGGMKLHRMDEMREKFGEDTFFLIGGGLMEVGGTNLEKGAQAFLKSAGREEELLALKKASC